MLAVNKVRGATNLRTKRAWVPRQRNPTFERHPKLHEWGHNVIPWQDKPGFLDDRTTLSQETHDLFEREANFIGAEANFQAGLFRERALGSATSIRAALALADEHEATYASTLWKYVEVMDTPVALLVYRRGRVQQCGGQSTWVLRQVNMSDPFGDQFESVEPPQVLAVPSPFLQALDEEMGVAEGTCRLRCDGGAPTFVWESWSNTYDLFVMVRRLHVFNRVGGLLRSLTPGTSRENIVLAF